MQKISLKNRIAYHYIISTGLLILLLFFVIYFIVKFSTYRNVDDDINGHTEKHLKEIVLKNGKLSLGNENEWNEEEHNTVELEAVFLELTDLNGNVFIKSPNLKSETLRLHNGTDFKLFDTNLKNIVIRQVQTPVFQNKKQIGYLIIAMSLSDSIMVLDNLLEVLLIAYPLVLLVLFLVARIIAGRSIRPISSIIETSNIITKDNLKSRIVLPQNHDELFVLSKTINSLLDRIETAVEREKQFTSHASHELRTPLTILKGTLEVMIRKPRNHEEYQEKIGFCIAEINRMDELIDQLLLLARFENQKQSLKTEKTALGELILDTVSRFSCEIQTKNIQLTTDLNTDFQVETDSYLLTIVLNNLLSNALKFSNENGQLNISLTQGDRGIECRISDTGRGIPSEDLEKIFDQFYRSHAVDFPEVKGSGLGLSIVNKLCTLLNIDIAISSQLNEGTTVTLVL